MIWGDWQSFETGQILEKVEDAARMEDGGGRRDTATPSDAKLEQRQYKMVSRSLISRSSPATKGNSIGASCWKALRLHGIVQPPKKITAVFNLISILILSIVCVFKFFSPVLTKKFSFRILIENV